MHVLKDGCVKVACQCVGLSYCVLIVQYRIKFGHVDMHLFFSQ